MVAGGLISPLHLNLIALATDAGIHTKPSEPQMQTERKIGVITEFHRLPTNLLPHVFMKVGYVNIHQGHHSLSN